VNEAGREHQREPRTHEPPAIDMAASVRGSGASGAFDVDLLRAGAFRTRIERPTFNVRSDHMAEAQLADIYRAYIACLNARDWDALATYVDEDAVHNGKHLGVAGYRAMLERDVAEIPDLRFEIDLLVADASHVASRLRFDCTPAGMFLGLPVDGRRVRFTENVFYRFRAGRIVEVWSLLDRAAIEAQLTA
jgi:predicted ester cyclase